MYEQTNDSSEIAKMQTNKSHSEDWRAKRKAVFFVWMKKTETKKESVFEYEMCAHQKSSLKSQQKLSIAEIVELHSCNGIFFRSYIFIHIFQLNRCINSNLKNHKTKNVQKWNKVEEIQKINRKKNCSILTVFVSFCQALDCFRRIRNEFFVFNNYVIYDCIISKSLMGNRK